VKLSAKKEEEESAVLTKHSTSGIIGCPNVFASIEVYFFDASLKDQTNMTNKHNAIHAKKNERNDQIIWKIYILAASPISPLGLPVHKK